MDCADHHKFFEGETHSNDYTKFRPKTPQQCIEWILEYLKEQIKTEDGKLSAAADIGCGTGIFSQFDHLVSIGNYIFVLC